VITGVSLLLFYMLIGIKLSLNTIILVRHRSYVRDNHRGLRASAAGSRNQREQPVTLGRLSRKFSGA